MPSKLDITISPANPLTTTTQATEQLLARLNYLRDVNDDSAKNHRIQVRATFRAELDSDGTASFAVDDGVASSTAELRLETAQGTNLATDAPVFPAEGGTAGHTFTVPVATYRGLGTPAVPIEAPLWQRTGRFTRFEDSLPDFGANRLYVAAVRPAQLGQGATNPQTAAARSMLGLQGTGDLTDFEVTILNGATAEPKAANALGLAEITLRADGSFDFALPVHGDELGWFWMLLGPTSYVGYQPDDIAVLARRNVIVIVPPLPAPSTGTPVGSSDDGVTPGQGTASTTPPLDFDEQQMLTNPSEFNDDPGQHCSPFSNPQRILGERPFFTVLRVDQPEIGSESSLVVSRPLLLDLASPIRVSALRDAFPAPADNTAPQGGDRRVDPRISRSLRMLTATAGGREPAAQARALTESIVSQPISAAWRKWLKERPQQRTTVSPRNPIEWEGDPTVYQAASVAGGHVLEHRVQWRSNGYSLGDVAYTLTLAPRQTRRITRLSWRRRETAVRREVTAVTDRVTQTTQRNRAYDDAVQSSLAEWAKGGSEASSTGAAGGFGFALGPVVIGGGAAHGRASSNSWQTGGRRVAASEHQSLRDSIRQFGESTRRLESTVVTELTQEEEVEGVSETVRNVNYCHSLTVLYHEILRHYRVDTVVAGVRECLFVPFAISPFDLNKTLKWRDKLRTGLLSREFRWALDRLDDVANAWVDSDIPGGRRSSHPVTYLTGSLYIKLSIERPRDREEEEDIEHYREIWTSLGPILGTSVNEILTRVERINRDRDAYYQREIATGMAVRWANRLRLVVGGATLDGADFTLASAYRFGGTARVDFTVPVDRRFTRDDLQNLTVRTDDPLPVGSTADLVRARLHYQTDHFDLGVDSVPTTNDLIQVDTGRPDIQGAAIRFPLTAWERQDLRRVIEDAVDKLIIHLNANLAYYHKVILWQMDRDELFILLDGFIAPYGRRLENGVWVEDTGRSVASVVEREPLGILGNSLVYRVGAGVFLGIDGHQSPAALHNYYFDAQYRPQPLRISLPTDGLYAQAIMDGCSACEEHYGSTDWVLTQDEPELELLADQLGTRRATPDATNPTALPGTLINLQNAPAAPDPAGLAGVLQAATNAQAFRDMAGLAGTQANAAAALTTAAGLANNFGSQAAAIELARLAQAQDGTRNADKKLASIQRAADKGLVSPDAAAAATKDVLEAMNPKPATGAAQPNSPAVERAINAATQRPGSTIETATGDGVVKVAMGPLLASTGTGELRRVCGFFGPADVVVSETDLRQRITDATTAEHDQWWNAGAVVRESANSQFGELVAYRLATSGTIRPTTFTVMEQTARTLTDAQYGALLAPGAGPHAPTAVQLASDIRQVRQLLLQGAPDTTGPANLDALIDQALRSARASRLDARGGAWSAAFVSFCVRSAAIGLGIEEFDGAHTGRNELLRYSNAHRVYALDAYEARFGPNARSGAYHAFDPAERAPQPGDIIVQDRRDTLTAANQVVGFATIPTDLAGHVETHGDIVIDVPQGQAYVVAIGGNVGGSSRIRHYPTVANGRLVTAVNRQYVQENDTGAVPNLPSPTNNALSGTSTARIFALLSPVEQCAVVPGQEYHGGVIT